jgi:hypothetical protein
LTGFDSLPTTAVAFTTDIPALGAAWGKPFLIGPGSIHVAHTAEERIAKKELSEAVEIYARMVTQLLLHGEVAPERGKEGVSHPSGAGTGSGTETQREER